MEKKENLFEKYSNWIEFSKMHYNPLTWILIAILLTILTSFSVLIISFLFIGGMTLLPFAFGSAVFIGLIGYPYLKKENIINSIERNFSDSLKQMADILKAGDTYESALREIANSDYGRLSEEMNLALRRLEEGENLENALGRFAERVDSKLIKRTITILLDSIRSGASLSEILEEIADDVKELYQIKEERKSETTMQFMFMIASGGIIAPIIFGEVNTIMGVFSSITSSVSTTKEVAIANMTTNFIFMLAEAYLIIEVIGSGIMMSLIREGKINKSIIYIPALLLLAFVVYYVSKFVIGAMLMGSI